jgi:ABC-type Fe3+/spermidine/putrescine transport system ATPase subunit
LDEGDSGLTVGIDAKAIDVKNVSKIFGSVSALRGCSLEARQGEIVGLLGPSGCGKTTLLNIIAGFERPDEGQIFLGGRNITFDPAYRRRTSMVFQQYALFPHMTVFRNIIYGLAVQGEDRELARQRAEEVSTLLRIQHLLDRFPAQLSGGQRQRVAVARALAVRPSVLLLDEAFSALDRGLREEMQIEFSMLLRNLGITTILVTHDQREAFALADRVAVMEGGRIRQFAAPEVIYRNPSSSSVFEFFGTANRLPGRVIEKSSAGATVLIDGVITVGCSGAAPPVGADVTIGVRAENVILHKTPTRMHHTNPFTVRLARFLGQDLRIVAKRENVTVICEARAARSTEHPQAGEQVYIDIDDGAARIIDAPSPEAGE